MRAGFGIRFGAVFIDGLIIGILAMILNKIFGASATIDANATADQMAAAVNKIATRAMLFQGLLGCVMAAIEIMKAQTPGKMLLKLIITSQDGSPARQDQLIKRAALKYGAWVFYVLAGITGVMAISYVGGLVALAYLVGAFLALKEDKLALHDTIGGTAVLQTNAAPAFVPGQMPPPPPAA